MATRKPRKFGDGGGVREGQNTNIDDDTRARAMKWVQQQQEGKSSSDDAPAKKAAPKAASKPAPKAEPKAEPKKASADDKPKQSSVDQIPRDKATPVSGEKVDSTELGRNVSNALNALPGVQAVGRMASAGKAAQKAAGSRAVSTAGDGVTFLGKSGRRQVGGFDEIARTPKAIADGSRKAVGSDTRTAIADNATKRITGPSKRDIVERDRTARASKRQSEMGETNASRHGLDTKSADYADKAKATRDNLGGSDWSLGMKRGGKVKPKMAFKAGGSVSSRADGIASRGKTRGKMC